ncbi:MAG: hypothetical protein JNL57_12280 [Bacteroidetes bacterium]|nr:hypothetical protein [Bacteroidota bacterium]
MKRTCQHIVCIALLYSGFENIRAQNQPQLISPSNGTIIQSEGEKRSLIFSWTPLGQNTAFRIRIIPVYSCQDANTAFRVNHPSFEQYCTDPMIPVGPDMELLDGTYIWSVQKLSSGPEQENWAFPWVFTVSTNGETVYDPCDTSVTPIGCQPPTIVREKGPPISVGMYADKEELFLYPRAVPIRAEAFDWDIANFYCNGCEGGKSQLIKGIRDQIAGYEWKLNGKGSLNVPYEQAGSDSMRKVLDALNNEIRKIEDSLASTGPKGDSILQEKITAREKEIESLKKQINTLDSAIHLQESKRNTAEEKTKEIRTLASETRKSLRACLDSIANYRYRTDTLQARLDGKPDAGMKQLLETAAQKEAQRKKAYADLENEQNRWETEQKTLFSNLEKLEKEMKAATEKWHQSQMQIEKSTQNVLRIRNQIFSDSVAYLHLLSRQEWNRLIDLFSSSFVSNTTAFHSKTTEAKTAGENFIKSTPAYAVSAFQKYSQSLNEVLKFTEEACKNTTENKTDCQGLVESIKLSAAQILSTAAQFISNPVRLKWFADLQKDQGIIQDAKLNKDNANTTNQKAAYNYQLALQQLHAAAEKSDAAMKKFNSQLLQSEKELSDANTAVKNREKADEQFLREHMDEYLIAVESMRLNSARQSALKETLTDSLTYLFADSITQTNIKSDCEIKLKELKERNQQIKERINTLKSEIEGLKKQKENNKKKARDFEKKLEDLRKKKEAAAEGLSKLTTPNKAAGGNHVYYIPPPLDELIRDWGKEPEYKKLRLETEKANDSLQSALARKVALQKEIFSINTSVAKNISTLYEAGKTLEQLEKEIKKHSQKSDSAKMAAAKEYQKDKVDNEKKLAETQKQKDALKSEMAGLKEEYMAASEEIEGLKDEIRRNDTLMAEMLQQIADLKQNLNEKIKYQEEHQQKITDLTRTVNEQNRKIETINLKIEALRDELTRLSAAEENQGVPVIHSELDKNKQEKATLEVSQVRLQEEIRIHLTETDKLQDNIDLLHTEISKIQTRYETIMDLQLRRNKSIREQEQEKKEKVSRATDIKTEFEQVKNERSGLKSNAPTLDSALAQNDAVQQAKEDLEAAEKKKEETEKARSAAEKDIKYSVEKISGKLKKCDEDITNAKDYLKEAEKKLKTFLENQFDSAHLDFTITLKAKDEIYDGWRSDDDDNEVTGVFRYELRKLIFTDIPAENNDPSDKKLSVCNPSLSFLDPPPPEKIHIGPGEEPRTQALLADKGKMLREKWPVIPGDAPLLAKDAVEVTARFKPDMDKILYNCKPGGGSGGTALMVGSGTGTSNTGSSSSPGSEISAASTEKQCPPTPVIIEDIKDMGAYTWLAKGNIIGPSGSASINSFIWEPALVPQPLPSQEQDYKALYTAAELAGDPEQKVESKSTVKPGILLEVPDSLTGSPEELLPVPARVVTGDHLGLAGETIALSVKLIDGNAEAFGFDGTSASVTKTTTGSGYIPVTKFNFGKNHGKFEIVVKWKRAENVIEEKKFEAISPLYLQFLKTTTPIADPAWDAAKKMIESGTVATDAALASPAWKNAKSFPRFASGCYDHARNYRKDIDLDMAAKPAPLKANPQKAKTSKFGIADSKVEKMEEDAEAELSSTATLEKLRPVCRPEKVSSNYSNSKIKEFKIGHPDYPFTIVPEEEITPEESFNGKGNIKININALSLSKVLEELELNLADIVVEEKNGEFWASSGVVAWETGMEKPFTRFGFELGLSSLGITANQGAEIKGSIKHKSMSGPAQFEATVDPSAEFYGTVSDMPGYEYKGFKLKEGAQFTLDFHTGKNAIPWEGDFTGVVIHTASLELPKAFTPVKDGDPATLSAKDFYVGPDGFGGEISLTGGLVKLGYAGYQFSCTGVALQFANSKLEAGTFSGSMELPKPMEGTFGLSLTANADGFTASLSTDKPVILPSLATTFLVSQATLEWKAAENSAQLGLSARISSTRFGEIEIEGFSINSDGEVAAEKISINKEIKIGSGFRMHIQSIGFSFAKDHVYSVAFDGKINLAGMVAIQTKATISNGPTLAFEELKVDITTGPAVLKGGFSYDGKVFSGNFAIQLKSLNKGIDGFIIAGSQEISKEQSFGFWYGQLTVSGSIPIGSTGVALLELGGGIGYNYMPPAGTQKGAPINNESFSLKALVALGSVPGGEVLKGRMEMVWTRGIFALDGKVWLLTREEAIYGQGNITVQYADAVKTTGDISMLIGLPDADGALFKAEGLVHFSYPPNDGRYVWTEKLQANVLNLASATGSVLVATNLFAVSGEISYGGSRDIPLGFGTLHAGFLLKYGGGLRIAANPIVLNTKGNFGGNWNVNITAFDTHFDIIYGNLNVDLNLAADASHIQVSGKASVEYSVLFYSGKMEVDFGYSS